MNRNTRFIVIGAVSAAAVVAIAQSTSNQTSQSNSQTQTGNGTARASASGSASASASGGGRHLFGGGNAFGESQGGGNMPLPNYVLVLNNAGRSSLSEKGWAEETAYWQKLAKAGTVTLAGNWREWDGGLVLINAANDVIAKNIADNDPGVKAGIFRYEIHAFEPRVIGSLQGTGAFGGTNGGFSNGSHSGGGSSSGGSSSGGSSGGSSSGGSSGGTSGGGTTSGGSTKSKGG